MAQTIYTKAEIDKMLANYYTKTQVDTMIASPKPPPPVEVSSRLPVRLPALLV